MSPRSPLRLPGASPSLRAVKLDLQPDGQVRLNMARLAPVDSGPEFDSRRVPSQEGSRLRQGSPQRTPPATPPDASRLSQGGTPLLSRQLSRKPSIRDSMLSLKASSLRPRVDTTCPLSRVQAVHL